MFAPIEAMQSYPNRLECNKRTSLHNHAQLGNQIGKHKQVNTIHKFKQSQSTCKRQAEILMTEVYWYLVSIKSCYYRESSERRSAHRLTHSGIVLIEVKCRASKTP